MTRTEKILEIIDLSLSFPIPQGDRIQVLKNVEFSLAKGEVLGVVGESGSGKSLTSLTVMGLLPKTARVDHGEIYFGEGKRKQNLLSEEAIETFGRLRGRRISMIFQEPMTSLNPVHRCGEQVAEVLRLHKKISKAEARRDVITLFEKVDLPRPEEIYSSYPHQISGGQKQRVMIATAVACEPDLIIADEPTTALDVTVQKQILSLLKKLCAENHTALIFITHDLGVVAEIANRVVVMRQGEVVEQGSVEEVLSNPQAPYTKALLACRPKLDNNPKRLPTVAEFEGGVEPEDTSRVEQSQSEKVLLKVEEVGVYFPLKSKDQDAFLKAVDGVSFQVFKGETLGLVGESGCGKSTLGRSIVGLQQINTGRIKYGDETLADGISGFPQSLRRKVQIIFQDPYSSLNPGKTVGQALEEPLLVHRLESSRSGRKKRVSDILDKVGLPDSAASKYPHQFSGGQRQRICIARTLMVEPDFIICDESVSALDVSVQAKVLNLLNDLKEELGLTYIFISHDLSVVKYMSDRLIVMRKGRIEEIGGSEQVYKNPSSEYTKSLLSSIPQF
jgi:peptide/nickel transport system ATP-binding protein